MVQKVKSLVGQIDCPYCFSLIQFNSISDVHVSNGNKYIICPECKQHLRLNDYHDYWMTEEDPPAPTPAPESIHKTLILNNNDGEQPEITSDFTIEELLENVENSDYYLIIKDNDAQLSHIMITQSPSITKKIFKSKLDGSYNALYLTFVQESIVSSPSDALTRQYIDVEIERDNPNIDVSIQLISIPISNQE